MKAKIARGNNGATTERLRFFLPPRLKIHRDFRTQKSRGSIPSLIAESGKQTIGLTATMQSTLDLAQY